jgi:hypothetical protein
MQFFRNKTRVLTRGGAAVKNERWFETALVLVNESGGCVIAKNLRVAEKWS